MKREKLQKQLIDILLKKANGFYYYEEQEEYEKTQNKSRNNAKTAINLSFFDNYVTDKQQPQMDNDTLKSSNANKEPKENNLVLVKKKVTKHYIPPDMFAIKILLEINKEKVSDDVENLSDEELLKLKDKLLGEILNENQ